MEDQIAAQLHLRDSAIFIVRATSGGRRELTYELAHPKSADGSLMRLAASPNRVREWRPELNFDPTWNRMRAVFTLLEGAQG